MGLKGVAHKDDPWNYKAYDLYRPIFTGGGTFEEYLKPGRYRRDTRRSPESYANRNVLTPEMLSRLLRIKKNFEKNYPLLYKTMMGQMVEKTTITVTPPVIPQHVSYPHLELAAAEINQLNSMRKKSALKQQPQLQTIQPLINSYKEELNFWENPQVENKNFPSTIEPTQVWKTAPQLVNQTPIIPEKTSLNSPAPQEEQQNFWQHIQETSNAHPEEQSFWENPQETLKTLNEQSPFLDIPPQETLTSLNEEQSFLENPKEPLEPSAVQKRNSFWADLEAADEREHTEDLDRIFNFDEDFD